LRYATAAHAARIPPTRWWSVRWVGSNACSLDCQGREAALRTLTSLVCWYIWLGYDPHWLRARKPDKLHLQEFS
jgi:hypothetical protein